MRTIYVDTGAFIALIWSRDAHHDQVVAHYRLLRANSDRLVTSDPVIAETATRLRYDAGLDAASASGSLTVRESDRDLRREAFAIMSRYDGLTLSYADAVGSAVATEGRASAVFGLDNDFRVLGHTLEP